MIYENAPIHWVQNDEVLKFWMADIGRWKHWLKWGSSFCPDKFESSPLSSQHGKTPNHHSSFREIIPLICFLIPNLWNISNKFYDFLVMRRVCSFFISVRKPRFYSSPVILLRYYRVGVINSTFSLRWSSILPDLLGTDVWASIQTEGYSWTT